ncbi:response regulator [bacterium]|nr:response regulator [bacterium]
MQLSPETSRILLAEDCPDTQRVLQFILQQTGAEVVTVNDGQQCVDRAAQEDFELVVLDIKMPNLNGVEALERLRANGNTSRVLALTASPSEEVRQQMEALGVSGFLSKLSDRKNLVSTVTELLKESREDTSIEQAGEKTIPLPVLPIYPEVMPQNQMEYENLFSFLEKVQSVEISTRNAVRQRALKPIASAIQDLGGASLYGYQILASQLSRQQVALNSGSVADILREARNTLRVMQGILLGREKVESKAAIRGITVPDKLH